MNDIDSDTSLQLLMTERSRTVYTLMQSSNSPGLGKL